MDDFLYRAVRLYKIRDMVHYHITYASLLSTVDALFEGSNSADAQNIHIRSRVVEKGDPRIVRIFVAAQFQCFLDHMTSILA